MSGIGDYMVYTGQETGRHFVVEILALGAGSYPSSVRSIDNWTGMEDAQEAWKEAHRLTIQRQTEQARTAEVPA